MYCTHESAHIGLDATYCPDCQQTFNFGSKTYVQILERGSLPEAPEDTKLGVVDDTKSSRGFEVSSASSVPSTHSHQFTPVWQSDCTLISGCNCGEKQECNILELREYQRSCINVRAEYFLTRDKCSSKARHEFTRAIADKDKQIVWLEHQIVELTDETPSELTKESHSFDSSTSTQITPIQIDSELRALIPPLSSEERSQLEVNLVAEGCRDPLVVWKGHHILLDGHNRYEKRGGLAKECGYNGDDEVHPQASTSNTLAVRRGTTAKRNMRSPLQSTLVQSRSVRGRNRESAKAKCSTYAA